MTWNQILPLLIVLAVAAVFVWRGSGSKKSGCDCHGNCSHDAGASAKKENSPR